MNRSDRLKNCNRSDHIEKIDSDPIIDPDQQTKIDLDPINDQSDQVLIDQSLIDQLIFKNTVTNLFFSHVKITCNTC